MVKQSSTTQNKPAAAVNKSAAPPKEKRVPLNVEELFDSKLEVDDFNIAVFGKTHQLQDIQHIEGNVYLVKAKGFECQVSEEHEVYKI